MIESNQIRSPRLRRLAVVQPGGTAADVERARVAGLIARLDPTAEFTAGDITTILDYDFTAAIAADLVRIGGRPEDLFSLPGMDWETATRISQAMTVLLSPGPRLSLVPEPGAEAEL